MTSKSYRVLNIEDSPEDRGGYRRWLARGGPAAFEFFEAATAQEGLKQLQEGEYDCILLDYQLPDATGLEVLQLLNSPSVSQRIAVVMLTGRGDEDVAVQAMKCGAQEYLVKDRLTQAELQKAIVAAVEKVELLAKIESQRAELEKLAITDPLTGLYNRRFFMNRLGEEVDRARRYGMSVSLLMIDLDHFKQINDHHGHLAGDRVLKSVAEIMKQLRKTDFACRYGGEEFCLLLTNTDILSARNVAERIRKSVAATVANAAELPTERITCSIGISSLTKSNDTPEDLLMRADEGLYSAKSAGRDRVCSY